MTGGSLRHLRELLQRGAEELSFADLPEPLLEDLALGRVEGGLEAVAALLSRLDGIAPEGRDQELAGRALLTLLARRGLVEPDTPADHVFLLGNPAGDEGDPEALRAHAAREEQYASLAAWAPEYSPEDFVTDTRAAFEAARTRSVEGGALPPDRLSEEHALALLGQRLPPGLRAHFHERYGPEHADAYAWKFVLVARALAHHRNGMLASGVAPGDAVPERLLGALLALDLADLARTSILEPI